MNDRTMIAAMFAAAAFSRNTEEEDWHYPDVLARVSIKFADALLHELDFSQATKASPELSRVASEAFMKGRNEALEEAAQFVERALEENSMLADQIRALKKSEVK